MKAKILMTVMVSLSVLSGCGGKDGGADAAGGGGAPKKVGVSCLAKFESDIAAILPLEVLAEVVDFGGETPEAEVMNFRSNKGVSWSWKGGRTRSVQVMGQTMDLPVDDQLAVTYFKVLDKAEYGPKDGKTYVEQNYRSISKEEMARIQEGMKAQLQAKVEKGELTQEQADLAGGMGGGFMGKERIVEAVEGVGDAARWTAVDRTLAVGHRNVSFLVYADLSADEGVNRDTAVALARRLLKDCN